MKFSLTKSYDENENVPFKRSIEKLQIKPESHVQFCNFDWIAIQKDSDITLYKEGLQDATEIDLTQLFGKNQSGKVQIYFFKFANEQFDQKQMILIGNNFIIGYDVIEQQKTCKIQMNDDYRLRRKLQFQEVQILEQDQTLYILTDHFDLITLNLSNKENRFNHQTLQKRGSFISNLLFQNNLDFYIKGANFKFSVFEDTLLIIQQTQSNQIKLYQCSLNPYNLITQTQRDFVCEVSNSSYQVNINNFHLSRTSKGIIWKLFAIIENKDQFDSFSQLKLITKEIEFIDQRPDQSNLDKLIYEDLNELQLQGNKIRSYFFQNDSDLTVLYSVLDTNYYHNNLSQSLKEHKLFNGNLQGVGLSINNGLSQLKVCSNGKIYILQENYHERPEQLVTHFQGRCMHEIIFNLLKEGYKDFIDHSNSNSAFLKLEFQAFSEQIICQVINQIVWDFMETPISKYSDIKTQLKENYKNLELWKKYTKTIVKNQQIILNLIRSKICLKIGEYIKQNENSLKQLIQECLNKWLVFTQYEQQFYSKLEDLPTIIEQLMGLQGQEQHLFKILMIIYTDINEEMEFNKIQFPKFWTNEPEWLNLVIQALSKLSQIQKNEFFSLFKFLITDISIVFKFERKISPLQFQVIQQFSNQISEEQFQDILIKNQLYDILFQCYLQTSLRLDMVFDLISKDEKLCQNFIDLCFDHEKNLNYQDQIDQHDENKFLHQNQPKRFYQILDQIEEMKCVDQVLKCVKKYPKLYNILLIRSMRLEEIQDFAALQQGNDPNAKYYRFLVDRGQYIVDKQRQQQIDIEQ
ncbi:unnamed protein product (macronuclear) [Paramecium tetraurelia]|uniref:Uncharacterized protein n=1 Tax=Paramecium tetraurelia TaxID=5888 RepID=A0CLD8_PARTE|nr:uncharacterized protein GSPATT00008153001 [Paramecium tetraurelia]CAK71605.1 unnamed protein product [Paramecium tetraurelia]|eukprot:XP_001439002.1 hypothetical protein (macronuclear) [Paramecium tetraurelia strain d4-2]